MQTGKCTSVPGGRDSGAPPSGQEAPPAHQWGVGPGLTFVQCAGCSGVGPRLTPIQVVTSASHAEAACTRPPCFWIFSAPSSCVSKLSHLVSGLTADLAVSNSWAVSETSTSRQRRPGPRLLFFPLGYAPAAGSSVPGAIFPPFVTILASARSAWPHRGLVVGTQTPPLHTSLTSSHFPSSSLSRQCTAGFAIFFHQTAERHWTRLLHCSGAS